MPLPLLLSHQVSYHITLPNSVSTKAKVEMFRYMAESCDVTPLALRAAAVGRGALIDTLLASCGFVCFSYRKFAFFLSLVYTVL